MATIQVESEFAQAVRESLADLHDRNSHLLTFHAALWHLCDALDDFYMSVGDRVHVKNRPLAFGKLARVGSLVELAAEKLPVKKGDCSYSDQKKCP
jgi:hypothetical protein